MEQCNEECYRSFKNQWKTLHYKFILEILKQYELHLSDKYFFGKIQINIYDIKD